MRCFGESVQKQFIPEIFGKQEGTVKYSGFVDCHSEDKFDTKLEALKEI